MNTKQKVDSYERYIKYKKKYLELKNAEGGGLFTMFTNIFSSSGRIANRLSIQEGISLEDATIIAEEITKLREKYKLSKENAHNKVMRAYKLGVKANSLIEDGYIISDAADKLVKETEIPIEEAEKKIIEDYLLLTTKKFPTKKQ